MRDVVRHLMGSGLLVLGAAACSPAVLLEPGSSFEVADAEPQASVRNGEILVGWHRGSSSSTQRVHVTSFVGGGWTTPLILGAGRWPQVALGGTGSGGAAFAVALGSAVRGYVRIGGVWSAPTTLDATANAEGVTVAADGSGNAIAGWNWVDTKVSNYTGGAWQPAVTLATGAGAAIEVAMNDAGMGVAAWCNGGVIYAARYLPASGWQSATASASNCCVRQFDDDGLGFHVAISDGGTIMTLGSNGARVCERHYVPATGWSGTTVLASGVSAQPVLAMNGAGNALVAWLDGSLGTRALEARAWTGGAWQPTLTGDTGITAGPIGVGLGSTGDGAIAYPKSHDVFYVTYNGTTLGTPVSMESLPGVAYYLDTAFDPHDPDQGVTVWQNAGTGATGEEIRASTIGF